MKELALLLGPLLVTVVVMTAYRQSVTDSGAGSARSELNLMQQQVMMGSSTVMNNMNPQQIQQQQQPQPQQGQQGQQGQSMVPQQSAVVSGTSSDTCGCPVSVTENECSVSGNAVLGGVDVVQYFTTFKNDDGTYDTTQVGVAGSSDYSSTYDGFLYYFTSSANKALFDASPTSYIPQWGGFCSWGIGYESCPPYAWSADCLGPSGDWGLWTIQNEKLYFFYAGNARDNFLDDPDTYIASGDARWNEWFSDAYSHMSTECYINPNANE